MLKFIFTITSFFISSLSYGDVTLCTAKIGYSQNLDKYDLTSLVELGAKVVVRASATDLDIYDLSDLASKKNAKLTLCIDSQKFDRYDVKKLADIGAELVAFTSGSKFDVYDYLYFAEGKSTISIVVNDDTLDVYDLKQLAAKKSIQLIILK